MGWVAYNIRNLLLTVLEAEKSENKMLADLVSRENLFPGSQMAVLSLCPHMAEGERELCGVSFIRALSPFMRAPPSGPNPPKSHTS